MSEQVCAGQHDECIWVGPSGAVALMCATEWIYFKRKQNCGFARGRFWRMYLCSGFWDAGISKIIAFFCQGSTAGKDHLEEISVQGNICQNHTFGKPHLLRSPITKLTIEPLDREPLKAPNFECNYVVQCNGQTVGQPRKRERRQNVPKNVPKNLHKLSGGAEKTTFGHCLQFLPIWSVLLLGEPVQCPPVTTIVVSRVFGGAHLMFLGAPSGQSFFSAPHL